MLASYALIHVAKFLELPDILNLGSVNQLCSSSRPIMLRQVTKITITRNIVSELVVRCPKLSCITIICQLEQKDYDLLHGLPIETLADHANGVFGVPRFISVNIPTLKSVSVYNKFAFDFSLCPLVKIDKSLHDYRGNTVVFATCINFLRISEGSAALNWHS
jgi:hypothetical protein